MTRGTGTVGRGTNSSVTLQTPSLWDLGVDKEAFIWFSSEVWPENGHRAGRLPREQLRQDWNPQRELRGFC